MCARLLFVFGSGRYRAEKLPFRKRVKSHGQNVVFRRHRCRRRCGCRILRERRAAESRAVRGRACDVVRSAPDRSEPVWARRAISRRLLPAILPARAGDGGAGGAVRRKGARAALAGSRQSLVSGDDRKCRGASLFRSRLRAALRLQSLGSDPCLPRSAAARSRLRALLLGRGQGAWPQHQRPHGRRRRGSRACGDRQGGGACRRRFRAGTGADRGAGAALCARWREI